MLEEFRSRDSVMGRFHKRRQRKAYTYKIIRRQDFLMVKKSVNDFYNVIGERIRRVRKDKGYNQEDIAKIIGVTYQQIYKYEAGISRIPVNALLRVASFLDVSLTELVQLPSGSRLEDTLSNDSGSNLFEEEQHLLEAWRKIKNDKIKSDILNLVRTVGETDKMVDLRPQKIRDTTKKKV